jgi:glycosyltransferase A (GT-A) superfamily protein (DUF2064 family)
MGKGKNALVLFTKYPEPGVTKTRLMTENGGSLTGEEAAALYKAMVLDTTETGVSALSVLKNTNGGGSYDFFISSSPEPEMVRVKSLFQSEFPDAGIGYVVDRGVNFDEHFNDCFRQLFDKGYDRVVCIGGDLPSITPDLLVKAFTYLDELEKPSGNGAMVLAPCQAAGVSLVGVTRSSDMDFNGVFYNMDGVPALDALVNIAGMRDIPLALLESLFDVDFMEDLGHTISVVNAMALASAHQKDMVFPRRTHEAIRRLGLSTSTPPNTSHDPRSRLDG